MACLCRVFSVQYWVCRTLVFNSVDETNHTCIFLQCAGCALWPLWLTLVLRRCCDRAPWGTVCLQSCRAQTCDWCFNGDGAQASGELRVHAAVRKWPRWHCGTLHSPVHEDASGKLCPCSPLQVRHTHWACWAFSLGAGTYGWIDYRFKDGHLVSVPQFQQPAQRKWVLRIGFRFATVALQLWYTLATIRGRLSERESGRERKRENSEAQQCYLIDQFVINLLPQAVVVRFYSVKGVCVSQARKCLSGRAYRAISEWDAPKAQ